MSFSSRLNPFFVRTSPNFWFPYLRTVRWVTSWKHAWDERLITDSLKSFESFLAVNLRRHSRGSNKILHQSEHGIDRSNDMWSQPLSALRCRMSSWALRRKSKVQSEYMNCSTIANILNSPIGGQARFQLISCIKVFVRATSTTFMRTIDSFPSQMLLISDSSFDTMIRQTYKYVVQIKRRDFSPFVVSVEVNFPSRLKQLPLRRSETTTYLELEAKFGKA